MKNFNNYTCQTQYVHLKHLQGLWRYAMGMLAIIVLVFSTTANGQAVLQGTAPVVIPTGGFGMDGDLRARIPNAAVGDWLLGTVAGTGGSVLDGTGTPIDPTTTFRRVDLYNSGDNIFAGGQKKNDNPNTMAWINGNPSPAKNDINNLLMHIGRQSSGDIWITVAGDRESTNGNSFISIALHQASLSLHPNITGRFLSEAPTGTGGRTPGDVQVSAEFTGGGSNPNLYLEEWKSVGGVYQWVSIPVPAGAAFGSTNRRVLSEVPYDVYGGSSYPVNAFIEVSFNISAIYRETATPCVGSISSALVMTKSSQAVSANLTDFVDPIQINLDINVGRPTASGADYCAGETINSITASSTETNPVFKWYTALNTEGKPTGTPTEGATYTPSINNALAGTYNFYVTQSIRGCESMHTVVTVNVIANPVAPTLAVEDPTCTVETGTITITSTTTDLTFSLDGGEYEVYPAGGYTGLVAGSSHTITAKNAGGCISEEASKTIGDAQDTPDAPELDVTQPTCETDGKITITSATAGLKFSLDEGEYADYPAGGYTGLAAGPHTITAKNADGCISGEATETINEVPDAPAAPTVSIEDVSLCGPSTATVTVTCPLNTTAEPSRYTYSNNGGTYQTSPVFGNLVAGAGFSITVKDNLTGCVSTATDCENYEEATCTQAIASSIQAESSSKALQSGGNQKVTAYPVPFYDNATVEFTSERNGNYVVNLYDMKGSLIRELKAGTAREGEVNKIEVDGRSLPEGMYLIRVVNGSGSKTVKLLKKQ